MNKPLTARRPIVVGIGGFTSEVGKTTLLCELLRALPGWEAIKTTRGHYRSCGKDPQACCVSHLLQDDAVVRSGRESTYEPGKDTGRYWDAGAVNVHWVIATDNQIDVGVHEALSRVRTNGVFIEGNSFTKFVEPDYFVMAVRADDLKIKTTARESLQRVSAYFVSGDVDGSNEHSFASKLANKTGVMSALLAPIFRERDLDRLVASINAVAASQAA